MKIIYTFWTKPLFAKKNIYDSVIYLLLSVNLIKQYASDIIIYTDEYGELILKKFFKTDINIETSLLNNLNLDVSRWSIPKLYVINKQSQPFLHIDHDVFLWEKIENFSNYDITVQSFEINSNFYSFYKELFINFISNNKKIHPFFYNHLINDDYAGYNCGYLNVYNLDLAKEWTEFAINLNNVYLNKFRPIDCTFVEQFSLYLIIKKYNFLANEIISMITYEETLELNLKYNNIIKFTHLMGSKQYPETVRKVENKIKNLYPEVYDQINNNINILLKNI